MTYVHRLGQIPSLLWSPPPFLKLNHFCSPPATSIHFHMHSDQSPPAIALRCWRTPVITKNSKSSEDLSLSHTHKPYYCYYSIIMVTHLVSNIIYNDNPMGTSVIARGDGAKSLLTSCIPLWWKWTNVSTESIQVFTLITDHLNSKVY